jgi:hypothetical protein
MATTYADPSTFMKTNVIFIIDSSGSMSTKQADVIGGFNQYVKELKDKNEPVILSAILFANESRPLFTGKRLDDVPELNPSTYIPAGGTALLDAIGDALKEYPVDAKVLVIIMTDGEENSSHRYSREEIKKNIEYCIDKGQWAFVYLGAGLDAFTEAGLMGIPRGSTMTYNAATTGATISATASTTSGYAAASHMTSPQFRSALGTSTLTYDTQGNVVAKWKPQALNTTNSVDSKSDPGED